MSKTRLSLIPCVGIALLSFLGRGLLAETVLVELGDTWKYFKGTQAPSDPSATWREQGFDDSTWLEGPTGIGYGDNDDATVLADMMNSYLSVFMRRIFTVDDPSAVWNLLFSVDYDDGFIAYLNGVEIARRLMGQPGEEFPFDRPADSSMHEAGTPEIIDVSAAVPQLVAGTNVLAIQVHNWALTSTDLSMRPKLIANSLILISPLNLTCTPADTDQDGRTDQVTLAWTNRAAYDSIRIIRNGAQLGDLLPGDTSSFIDSSLEPFADSYQVIATFGGSDCTPLSCTVALCDNIALTCALSLQGEYTGATLSWNPPLGTETIDVTRESTLLATLPGADTGYFDPNVEAEQPEDDTSFVIIFHSITRTCTASTPEITLCPSPAAEVVDVAGEPRVLLTWGNMVKLWQSFTILRDGTEIASGLPGDSTEYLDETVVPQLGVAITYTLRPVAPPGRAPSPTCDRTASVTPLPLTERPFGPPEGGWDYLYDVEAHPGVPQDLYVATNLVAGNLDGRWIRASIDSWDGSAIGDTTPAPDGLAPGGIQVVSLPGNSNGPCHEDIVVLEIVDPGNPTAYTAPNNRQILLGIDAGAADRNLLRSGVTFAARWRLTPSPVEVNTPGLNGDGETLTSTGGLGQIGFYFRNDGSPGLAGEGPSASYAMTLDSSNGMEFGTNPVVTFSLINGTAWRSVWVTIEDPEGDGTYDVRVYLNGSTIPLAPPGPTISGDGLALGSVVPDLGPAVINALAIGLPALEDDGSIQIDFVAMKIGVHPPVPAECLPENHRPTARIALTPPSGEVGLRGGTAQVDVDGSGSDDGDGGTQGLSYRWSVVSGPDPGSIESPASQSTAILFDEAGVYEIELVVDDGQPELNVHSAQVTVTVLPENHAPTARIAIDPPSAQVPLHGGEARVALDGSGSEDNDGGSQTLTFRWAAEGPGPVAFDSPAAAMTGARFTSSGLYLIRLTVNDGGFLDPEGSTEISVQVQPENHAPTARITRDPPGGIALGGGIARATLSGSGSDDGDGGSQGLSFLWSLVSGPAPVTFDDPHAGETAATFTEPGSYRIELTVDDGQIYDHLASLQEAVLILPGNQPPTARIAITPPGGSVELVGGTARVKLDGSLSDDGDGGIQGLTYRWAFVSGPAAPSILSPDSVETFVDFVTAGTYTLELTVDDHQSFDHSSSTRVDIQVIGVNNPPHARIAVTPPSGEVELLGGQAEAALDGSSSDDGDGGAQTLTFRWRVASGPGAVTFEDILAARTTAAFTVEGTYSIELTVDDGQSTNHSDIAHAEIRVIRGSTAGFFRRGDWNFDTKVDISDPVAILNFLYLAGADNDCHDAGDANDDGALDISDPVNILNWLFLAGEDLASPGPTTCGPDLVQDPLPECRTVCP